MLIACEPPLGCTTVSSRQAIEFLVIFEWDNDECLIEPCQVVIWHNGVPGGVWTNLILQPYKPAQRARAILYNGTFVKDNDNDNPVLFTLKFLHNGAWKWANDIDPKPDGQIFFNQGTLPDSPSSLFKSLNPEWRPRYCSPGVRDVRTWHLISPISSAREDESTISHVHLGLPVNMACWFAVTRMATPWLAPKQGDGFLGLDAPAILLSFLQRNGVHVVLLAVNGLHGVLTTIGDNGQGHVVVTGRNDSPSEEQVQIVVAASYSLEEAMTAAMEHAKKVISAIWFDHLPGAPVPIDRDTETWYDAFTYCTWNGLGQQLSPEKIFAALKSLSEHGVDISNLIIDDNWQSIDDEGYSNFNHRWLDFEANRENFPKGLKQTITKIRERYPKIHHIAVWHGIFGYWNGISSAGSVAREYETKEVQKQGTLGYMGGGVTRTVTAKEVHRFYDDFYKFLSSCGVDAVKADVQFYPDYLQGARDRHAMIYAYQDAWDAATLKHFQGRAISCMSMTPQILFHSLLNPNKPRLMARNSDDFFPFDPSSHTRHIFANAHNALLTQHLNVIPDWDMFQTVHDYAPMHAAARCLSGGPIYITDEPGKHDMNLIAQMTARSIAGRTITLRPETIGTALEPYNKRDTPRFLRIGTTHQRASLLGLFNISDRPRIEFVTLAAFRGIDSELGYVIQRFSNGKVFPCNPRIPAPDASEGTELVGALALQPCPTPAGVEILTVYPVWSPPGVQGFGMAVLGLMGKMTGIAAVRGFEFSVIGDGSTVGVAVDVKAVGVLGIYLAGARDYLIRGDVKASLQLGQRQGLVKLQDDVADDVLRLDIEAAWAGMQGDGVEHTANTASVLVRVRLGAREA